MRTHRAGFQRGTAPTFNCDVCGRRTRPVDSNVLCQECFDLAGYDNYHNDNGFIPNANEMAVYEAIASEAINKGGNGRAIRESFDYIWRKRP